MILKLMDIVNKCIEEMHHNARMALTSEDNGDFNNATHCYLCSGPLDETKTALQKVRDHGHRTGKCRGAAHCKCNIV